MYADDHQIYEVRRDVANVKSSLSRNAEKHLNGMKTTRSRVAVVNSKPWQCRKKEITNPTMSIQRSEI